MEEGDRGDRAEKIHSIEKCNKIHPEKSTQVKSFVLIRKGGEREGSFGAMKKLRLSHNNNWHVYEVLQLLKLIEEN